MKRVILPNGITMGQLAPSKNTRPERVVRMFLVSMRIKHRRNYKGLPGTPDFWLPDHGIVIHACGRFWHCFRTSKMKSMSRFWREKFANNRARDRKVKLRLRELGIPYVTVWDSDIRKMAGYRQYDWRMKILKAVSRSPSAVV